MSLKRRSSRIATDLTARQSPLSPRVTLVELPAKRTKNDTSTLPDLEDAVVATAEAAAFPTTSAPTSPTKAASASPARPGSSSGSPRKTKHIPRYLDKPHPAPTRWREAYDAIREMRKRIPAPVDTMGCQRAQDGETDPRSQRFATLVSLMLSSQTKDEVTFAAVQKLRETLGGTLTVEAMLEADESTIAAAISKVGFWRRKAEYLKRTALILRDEFASDVPRAVDDLCSLPGVGPKMAFLTLQSAWNINAGIGVDVHVHRITNRLGWHKKATKTPEETRLNLQSWLPKELHGEINHMLVGFGQTICVPVGPRCDLCDLSVRGLCPSAQKVNPSNRKAVFIAPIAAGPEIVIELPAVKGEPSDIALGISGLKNEPSPIAPNIPAPKTEIDSAAVPTRNIKPLSP